MPLIEYLEVHKGTRRPLTRTGTQFLDVAPTLGKGNEYLYNELLGVSDEEFAGLERLGQIGTTYPKVP